jgi:hypothetical protein
MPIFSIDGGLDPKALAVLAKPYVGLKVLPGAPDSRRFLTEAFLRAK